MAIDPRQAFQEAGAVMDGHFLLTSGRHSPVYWEKFRVLQQPEHTQALCGLIAARFREQRIQLVAGPTLGGMLLAFEVARQLGVRAVYAEKEGAGRAFRRGFTVSPGDRLLIVDDIRENAEVIKFYLKEYPVRTETAENGEEALNGVKRNPYDIILMDIRMPVMDGLTATERIRQLERQGILPRQTILAITAHAFQDRKSVV